MEDECSPLSWDFCYQEEGFEDIRHSLVYTTLELEETIVSAKEEITRRECEIIHLNDLLSRVIKERDEAQEKCRKLMLEKLELQQEIQQKQQQQQLLHNHLLHEKDSISQNEDELQGCISKIHCAPAASSDCDESNIASPNAGSTTQPPALQAIFELAEKKPLPEKGKLLKAVVEAGPLLQTLLLAGPLPQWQHPPPQLHSIEIPPVTISSPTCCLLSQDSSTIPCLNNKRDLVLCAATNCLTDSKHRKLIMN